LARGQIVIGAVGAGKQSARQIVAARARRQHRLKEIGARMTRIELGHAPGHAQHVLVAPGIAQRRRVFAEQAEIVRRLGERALEPRQRSNHALRIARQLRLELERARFARIGRDRLRGGRHCQVMLARAVSQTPNVHP
jgi:hypothetical protein